MNKKKIGIKFCGGCNPKYDRAAWLKKLQEKPGEKIEWVYGFYPEVSLYLVICGCETACADVSPLTGKKLIRTSGKNQEPEVLSLINEILNVK